MSLKTIHINSEIHNRAKQFCIENGYKFGMWIQKIIEAELEKNNVRKKLS